MWLWFFMLSWTFALAAEPLPLRQAVEEAIAHNPKLKALRSEALAKRHRPSQVGALPDPQLFFKAMNLPTESFATGREPMIQLQVGIAQKFPFPGKLSLKERAALLEAAMAEQRFQEARLKTIAEVKRLWWQLFALDRSLQKLKEARTLLEQFLKVAETRYRVGKGLQQDVLLAQLELSRLADREVELRRRRRDLETRLNALLDRPADARVELPSRVRTSFPKKLDGKRLYREAGQRRPLLKIARLEIERAEALLKLAQRNLYPDITLSAAYGVRTEFRDFATFGIRLDLPVYAGQKQLKAISERAKEKESRYHGLREVWRQVTSEIEIALSDFEKARERLRLLETTLLPQARQTVAAMLAAYQVGKVDFLNLVRAELILLEHEIDYFKRLAEVQTALAKLAAAIGQEDIQPSTKEDP